MEIVKNKAVQILGFDPCTNKFEAFIIEMTPEMAKFILDNHNNDNRKLNKTQKKAIIKSVKKYGWLKDGGSVVFTTKGNILEFQHRLLAIVELDITVPVVIITGCDPDAFQNAAPPKTRTKGDVIAKKDKSVLPDEVTTLNQILNRRCGQGDTRIGVPTLSMTNAVEMWELWKEKIRAGNKLTEDFFDGSQSTFVPWKRQINAFASLSIHLGEQDTFVNFIRDLKEDCVHGFPSALFSGMDNYFKMNTTYMSGPQKAEQVWYVLCHSYDRYKQHGTNCQFTGNTETLTHSYMVKKSAGSVYRRFLQNPDGLKIV